MDCFKSEQGKNDYRIEMDALFIDFLNTQPKKGGGVLGPDYLAYVNNLAPQQRSDELRIVLLNFWNYLIDQEEKFGNTDYGADFFEKILGEDSEPGQDYKAMIDYWLSISKVFNAKAGLFKDINLEEIETIEEINQDKAANKDSFADSHNSISLQTRLDQSVAAYLASVSTKQKTKLGLPKPVDLRHILYTAHEVANGLQSTTEMIEAWKNSGNNILIDFANSLPPPTVENQDLLNKVFATFSVSKLDIWSVIEFEDSLQFIRETNTNTERIKDQWQINFERHVNVKNNIKKGKVWPPSLSENFTVTKGNFKDIMRKMGIVFLKETLEDQDYKDAVEVLVDFKRKREVKDGNKTIQRVDTFEKRLKEILNEGLENPWKQLSSNGNFQGFRDLLKPILDVESRYSDLYKSKTVRTAKGKLKQAESENNTGLQVQNRLKVVDIDNLSKEDQVMLSNYKSIMHDHSLTKRLNRVGEFQDYASFKDRVEKKEDLTNDVSTGKWLTMNIFTMLKHGIKELLRTETSSSSWAWGVGKPWVHTKEKAIEAFQNYLVGDIKRLIAYREFTLRTGVKVKDYIDNLTYVPFQLSDLGIQDISELTGEGEFKDIFTPTQQALATRMIKEYLESEEAFIKEAKTKYNLSKKLETTIPEGDGWEEKAAWNLVIHNIEEMIHLFGGIEHYKSPYKRIKALISSGKTIPQDEWVFTVESELAKLEGGVSNFDKLINTSIIKDPELNADYIRYALTGMTNAKRAKDIGYNKQEIADGQGITTLDFYRFVGKAIGNWSKKDEALYQWEVAYYAEVIQGNVSKEDFIKQNPRLDHAFSVRKMQYFGGTSFAPELNLQVFDKFSLAPLVPSVVHGRNIEGLMRRMAKENLAYVKMESGTKVSKTTSGQMSAANNLDELTANAYQIHIGLLKEQQPTKSEYKTEENFGTQFRKLLPQDIFNGVKKDGSPKFKTPELGEKYFEYKKVVDALFEKAKNKLYKDLDIVKQGDKIIIKSFKGLIKRMEKEAIERDMIKAVRDFIELNRDSEADLNLAFEATTNKQTLEKILTGIINKTLVRQKVNGSNLIQVSSWGFSKKDSQDAFDKYTHDELRFYEKKKEGNRTVVKAAQAKIAMSKNFFPLLNKYGSLENLNEALKTGKEVVKIIGKRIPTQGLASMDVFEVQEFLPQSEGNVIIPPPAIVAKTGSDFDIDKMSFIFPIYNENGTKKKDLINDLINVSANIILDPSNYDSLMTPLGTDLVKDYITKAIIEPLYGVKDVNGNFFKDTKGNIITTVDARGFNAVTLRKMIDKRDALIRGKRLLGVAATATTFLQLYLSGGVKLQKYTDTTRSNAQKKEIIDLLPAGNLNSIFTTIGKKKVLKSEVFSQLVNATVDAATDDFLGYSNFNIENMGMVAYMILKGHNYHDIVDLLNQPILHRRFQRKDANTDPRKLNLLLAETMKKKLNESNSNDPKIKHLIELMVKTNKREKKEDYFTFESYDVLLWAKKHKYDLKKHLRRFNPSLGNPIDHQETWAIFTTDKSTDYVVSQIVSLAYYAELRKQSQMMFEVQRSLSWDTATLSNPIEAAYRKSIADQIKSGNHIVTPESYERMRENTIISSFKEVDDVQIALAKKVFPVQINDLFLTRTVDLINRLKLIGRDRDKFIRNIKNHYLEYLVKRNDPNYEGQKTIDNIIGFAFREDIQEALYEKGLFNNFFQNLTIDTINFNDAARIKDSSNDTLDKDLYTENLDQIMAEDFDIVPKVSGPRFAENIGALGFYQNGFNITYGSWAHLVPPRVLQDYFNKNLKQTDELTNEFFDYWITNFLKGNKLNIPTDGRTVMNESDFKTSKRLNNKTLRSVGPEIDFGRDSLKELLPYEVPFTNDLTELLDRIDNSIAKTYLNLIKENSINTNVKIEPIYEINGFLGGVLFEDNKVKDIAFNNLQLSEKEFHKMVLHEVTHYLSADVITKYENGEKITTEQKDILDRLEKVRLYIQDRTSSITQGVNLDTGINTPEQSLFYSLYNLHEFVAHIIEGDNYLESVLKSIDTEFKNDFEKQFGITQKEDTTSIWKWLLKQVARLITSYQKKGSLKKGLEQDILKLIDSNINSTTLNKTNLKDIENNLTQEDITKLKDC